MIKDNVFIVPVSNPFGKFGRIKQTLTLPFIKYTGEEDELGLEDLAIKLSLYFRGVILKGMWGNIALLLFSYFADYVDNIFLSITVIIFFQL